MRRGRGGRERGRGRGGRRKDEEQEAYTMKEIITGNSSVTWDVTARCITKREQEREGARESESER